MIFGYLTLATALIISLSAAVYSILGLTAIFAAAFWPIVIMGGSLEVGKIVATLWLHKYWDRAELQYKAYLCLAVAILMMLTSMGVFGFLSKAHGDQSLVAGDVGAKIAVYDEKIKIEKDNIDANRRALQQMDAAVDQVMGRSTDEKGADKAVAIRRSQAKERSRLLAEITDSQKKVTALNEQRAPIAAENRKVEAEVGPVKYIAALIYGDNPDANVLEKSVRWVIILIVVVFDPLALTLLLAATKSIEWERGINIFNLEKKKRDEEEETAVPAPPAYEPDDGALTEDQIKQINDMLAENAVHIDPEIPEKEKPQRKFSGFGGNWMFSKLKPKEQTQEEIIDETSKVVAEEPLVETEVEEPAVEAAPIPVVFDARPEEHLFVAYDNDTEEDRKNKLAAKAWKEANPEESITYQRRLHELGRIPNLPWQHEDYHPDYRLGLEADNVLPTINGEVRGFGSDFPTPAVKGDMFLRVDRLPSILYKYNGTQWIEADKGQNNAYAYNTAYIDYLISKIDTGEYDPELLSDSERDQIEARLKETK
jgi:hypothetical protein